MPRSPERFRLVSYNVRYFGHASLGIASCRASRRGIAAALTALRPAPDLICLQEVETRSLRSLLGRPPKRPGETQLEAFMGAFEEFHAAMGIPFPWEAFYFQADTYKIFKANIYTTGLAVLVNRDRLTVGGHNAAAPERITHHHVELFKEGKQTRICAHLQVRTRGGRRLHVFNTHLSLPTPFAKDFWTVKGRMGFGTNQVEEARKLGAFVQAKAAGEPFTLCGDFNAPPGSPVYQCLTGEIGCTGAQESLGHVDPGKPGGFPTAGFLRYRMHLDHLFSGGGVRWLDLEDTHRFGKGPFRGLSDHVPLIGRFEIRG